ncbi:hypothetical protein BK133_20095 [Paenibacillus sp. FSL H8-0548]|nr:hypothetical protein BK133_20095 [Paenibacillus sp. FSL H8-0548]
MRLKLKSVYSNANVQDRQLREAEKREVSANMQDSLRAEEAGSVLNEQKSPSAAKKHCREAYL